MKKILAAFIAQIFVIFAWLVTAVRGNWVGTAPNLNHRVYYANHVSNGDFVLLWSVLPANIRRATRPVAALDYWFENKLRRFAAEHVFRAVLVDRNPENRKEDPIVTICKALADGDSLIIFPEGKRNMTDELLLPFRSGIYNMAKAHPDVEFVPVWIDNLNAILPKGALIPIPLLCTVSFGKPVLIRDNESHDEFLTRAHNALLNLAKEVKK